MPLHDEKARVVREIDRYTGARHDEDKKRIGRSCKAAVELTRSYAELIAALRAYKDELDRLHGTKNARRWFSHKPGDLHRDITAAIARCTEPARVEAELFRLGRARPDVTLRDWNRHGGGTIFVVNGRGFKQDKPTLEDIDRFLSAAGILNARIRGYVCDYANQDGLFAAGHVVVAAAGGRGLALSFAGMRHLYTSGKSAAVLGVRDEADFDVIGTDGEPPRVTFVQEYSLEDNGERVTLREARYSFANIDRLRPPTRGVLESALDRLDVG